MNSEPSDTSANSALPAAERAVAGPVSPPTPGASADLSEEQIWQILRTCYDPEIPVNIVDLGLVYDVVLDGSKIDVKMTLTAPGCHLG
jgi:hypothetical protein